jgi:hypothetical protein
MKWEEVFCNTFSAISKRLGIPAPSEHKTDMVKDSRSDDNALCHEMLTNFGFTEEQMHRAAERFHLGRSKSGKTIYWMIDDIGRALDGRIGNSWVSTLLKLRYPAAAPHLKVEHCLFGLHQISECGSLSKTQADPMMGRADARSKSRDELVQSMPCKEEGDRRSTYHNVRATGGAVASSPYRGRPWRGWMSLGSFSVPENEQPKPIGIVESERSAVLLSELCPDLLWLAYSYSSNLTIEKFEPLQGHKITFYPRTDPNQEYYLSFLELADQVKRAFKTIDISVSRFLEDNATDAQKQRNIDLLEFMLEK